MRQGTITWQASSNSDFIWNYFLLKRTFRFFRHSRQIPYFIASRQKVTHFYVLGQKVTQINEGEKEKEEGEKRKEKGERERMRNKRSRGSLALSLSRARAIHFLPFPLKFSISSEPASQVPVRCATLVSVYLFEPCRLIMINR